MAASGGSRTKERARERIERLAGQGLDLPTLWREATVALAPAVPHYHAPCWFTLDPATLLVTSHYDPGIPELPAEWLAHQYFEEDVHKLADVARSERGISTLYEATGGDPGRSPGWNAFVRPFGGEQELLLALRTRTGEVWGMVGLYREPGRPRFELRRDALSAVRRAGPRRGRPAGAAGGRGGRARRPRGPRAGRPGRGLARRVADARRRALADRPPGASRGAPGALPPAVLAVAGQALRAAQQADAPGEVALSRVLGTDGRWLVLHGAALAGPGRRRVAVIVEPAQPSRLAPLLMAAFGLTEREQDVTRMVLQGESTTEIAAGLHVSPHTVQQHLKRVFEKTGVRSRRELAGKVFLSHYEPRLRDNERRALQGRALRGGPSSRPAGGVGGLSAQRGAPHSEETR